jgi:predicted nucleotidyltransferase
MLNQHITIPYDEISAFCQRHHIRKLALFGSVLRPDFSADSDIDVLVEFEPEHVPGWEFVGLQEELTQMLGREVDLNTYGSLSRHFRDKVVQNAQVIYGPMP